MVSLGLKTRDLLSTICSGVLQIDIPIMENNYSTNTKSFSCCWWTAGFNVTGRPKLEKAGKGYIARGTKLGNIGKVKGALDKAPGWPGVSTSQEEWDTDPYKLGLAHGAIRFNRNPKPGQKAYKYSEQAKKEWKITLKTNVDFIPWAEQENHRIEDIRLGYQELNAYLDLFIPKHLHYWLQLIIGHTLIGGNREKIAIYLYGGKDTGKSTISELFYNALGQYAGIISPRLFQDKVLNPALQKRYRNVWLVVVKRVTWIWMQTLLKSITGNEPIQVEIKNSNNMIENDSTICTHY